MERRKGVLLHFYSSEQERKNKKEFKQWNERKVVQSGDPGGDEP